VIPQPFIQELLARTDIAEVVGRYVQLKKAGINLKGLCPFHGEKTPSFIVSPTRQTYHCFGCGAHGNAVGFLMEHAGMGFIDAVRDLAQQCGLPVPEDDSTPEERERAKALKERQSTLTDVLAKAAEHYRKQLKASPRAVQYLKGRGLTGEIAARFGMGYAPEGWRGLASVFPRYDDPLLAESGLVIVQGDEGEEQKRYDRFRDRVMFPIRSVQGEVIGFGGRVLDSGEPKYLNSPETPVFVKGRELYGLYEARAALRERGYVLVTEGYMDVVALAQLGFPNAVATLGTACTAEHVHKLFRFTDRVVFSFDGDAAGRRAAARALEAALPHASDTRSIKFLFLPSEHDPDSYVREFGSEAFEQCVNDAVPLSQQLIEHVREGCDLGTAEGRAHMLANAKPLVAQLPNGLLREQLVGELAGMGGVTAEQLAQHWGGGGKPQSPARQNSGPGPRAERSASAPSHSAPRTPPRAVRHQAATLLDRAAWMLLHRSELSEHLSASLHDLLGSQPQPYGDFFRWLDRTVHDHGPLARAALVEQLEQDAEAAVFGPLVSRLNALHEVPDEADPMKDLEVTLLRLRMQALREQQEALAAAGDLSEPVKTRLRELKAEQDELTAAISAATAPPGR
jgi:DNA primase